MEGIITDQQLHGALCVEKMVTLRNLLNDLFFPIDGGMEYENVGRFEWILVLALFRRFRPVCVCGIDPLWSTYMFGMFSLEL